MEVFREKLKEYDVEGILDHQEYQYPGFTGDERLFSALDDIITNNKKVYIHGDSDCDGVFAAKIVECFFKEFKHNNYEVHKYLERSHVLTEESITSAIQKKFDYMIILDSSVNDLAKMKILIKFGIIPIIIDHHVPEFSLTDYPEEAIVIDTVFENYIRKCDYFKLSGGALTFCLFGRYLEIKGKDFKFLAPYALVTLYSDCIDMTRDLNRSIYYLATEINRNNLPVYFQDFMEDYDVFCRRFIEFTLSPKINALFRAEELHLVNRYLFEDHSVFERKKLVTAIKTLHESSRQLVNIATDSIKRENLNNIVIANLNSTSYPIYENKLYNYTGVVANGLSTDYGKPCVVLCDTGTGIKASFRDLLSRNYLPKFKQFCRAAGHGPAFAINLNYTEYNQFMWYLREKIDKKFFILGVDDNINLESTSLSPDVELLENVALYNEFSGSEVPIALITKRNNLRLARSYNSFYKYRYKWGEFTVSSVSLVPPGMQMRIKPIRTKKLKLIVFNRSVML